VLKGTHESILDSIENNTEKENKNISYHNVICDNQFAVKINNLTYQYENNRGIFDVSLEIKYGQFVVIVGESGSGKSTLLQIIYETFLMNQNCTEKK